MSKPRAGYLVIDHRNSPGMPAGVVRAAGIAAPIVVAGQLFESETITCAHCNKPFALRIPNGPGQVDIGYCRKCDRYLCDAPACNAECTPYIKILDVLQERAFREEAGYSRRLLLSGQ